MYSLSLNINYIRREAICYKAKIKFTFISDTLQTMLDPLDRELYRQMGYDDQIITQAHQLAKAKKIDIFDALNNVANNKYPSSPNQNPPRPQPHPLVQQKQKPSLLVPIKTVKIGDYYQLFSKHSKNADIHKGEIRSESNPVGLLNVSNCCYLNSLLQCYFLMNDFVKEILKAQPLTNLYEIIPPENKTKLKRIKNEYDLLSKLKVFFSKMAISSSKYLDPSDILKNLVNSVGDKIAFGEEKDLSEINLGIIERLSECLMYTKEYYVPEEKPAQLNAISENDASTNVSFFEESDSLKNKKGKQDPKRMMSTIFNVNKNSSIKGLFYGTKVEYSDIPSETTQIPEPIDFTGIILNPLHRNLYKSLDEELNYEVVIDNKSYLKQTYIRDEPEYIFFYINRTLYDRSEQVLLKNSQKIIFDFTIYLDRYLERNRKESNKNEQILDLLNRKNLILKKIHHLDILEKKIDDCYVHALELDWLEKLPKKKQIVVERGKFEEQIQTLEKDLEKIELRKEKYVLAYIFVHRGDAASGHYWGYGKNQESWYKFDINTKRLEEKQIITDLQKSGGTPYALVYVKEKHLPSFKYRYHLQNESHMSVIHDKMDFSEGLSQPRSSFTEYLSESLKKEIVFENVLLHQEIRKREVKIHAERCLAEYLSRFNSLKKVITVFRAQKNAISFNLPIYNNLQLFLASLNQNALFKFAIFQLSFFCTSSFKITTKELLAKPNEMLLKKIQKKFRGKLKNEETLKQYALLGKEKQKFQSLFGLYTIGKIELLCCLKLITQFFVFQDLMDNLQKDHSKENLRLAQSQLGRVIAGVQTNLNFKMTKFYKETIQNVTLYISSIKRQVESLMLFAAAIRGWAIEPRVLDRLLQEQNPQQSFKVIKQIKQLNQTGYSPHKSSKAGDVYVEINEIVRQFDQPRDEKRKKSQLDKSERKFSITDSQTSIERESSSPTKERERKQLQSKIGLFLQFEEGGEGEPKAEYRVEYWRTEEIDKIKINFDFSTQMKKFLQRETSASVLYKEVEREGKIFDREELEKRGFKNCLKGKKQKIQEQQSLI